MSENENAGKKDFIREAIDKDLAEGVYDRVHTRFPPEPNGYLHIGHAKAISISFGIALDYNGKCNLRFDDTNPAKEKMEYAEAIQEDVRWLGFQWEGEPLFASDYYERLYGWAKALIEKGKAYVCDLNDEEIREYRGTGGFGKDGSRETPPGKDSPYRGRGVEENLDLFRRMREGEFADGSKTLRAKIDMAHPNLNMRDPVMYRIARMHHFRQGDEWRIYPMYDWTHGQSDSIEGVTHSICDVGFENHRPLYEWFLNELGIYKPRQIEFGRLNITHTVLSKRYLRQMVEEGIVDGWDDPRLPTLKGLRRRGYPPQAIVRFCNQVGVSKSDGTVEIELLQSCVRNDLNKNAPRVMGVLDPLKVVIANYPEGQEEELDAVNNPEDESAGLRKVPFGRELYIERDDFMEDPPRKFFRLGPGREVRLRYAYYITCQEAVKDADGNIVELRCVYDPATKGGDSPDGRKVKGTLHWVSASHAIEAEVRLYDHLFAAENPMSADEGKDWKRNINPDSLRVVEKAFLEPSLRNAEVGAPYQFERLGYFCKDPDSSEGRLAFNRTVALRDTWAKQKGK